MKEVLFGILATFVAGTILWAFVDSLGQPVVYKSYSTGAVEKVIDRSGVEHSGDSEVAQKILDGRYDIVHTK